MDEKELLMHTLTKSFGLTENELSEKLYDGDALKEDAADTLLTMDATRVSKIKGSIDKTQIFDDAYNKATKETREKFEKKFKETTGYESDLQGMELVTAWGETLKVKPKTTEDEVKMHPLYINLEKDVSERYASDIEKLKNEYVEYKASVEESATMSNVLSQADVIFTGLNPVLSEDPVRAKNQKDLFFLRFKGYEYENVDGKYIVMEDGKRKEDQHGNPIYLDNFVSTLTNQHFDIRVQDDKNSPSNKKKVSTSVTAPKTAAEYNKAISNATSDEEMIQIRALYDANRID